VEGFPCTELLRCTHRPVLNCTRSKWYAILHFGVFFGWVSPSLPNKGEPYTTTAMVGAGANMEMAVFKTYVPKPKEPGWVLIDAAGQPIGRVASRIAAVLRGKHKPDFTPNMAMGDCVVVINADKVVLKGSKPRTKVYTRYSGYPGGLKRTTGAVMLAEKPVKAVEHAVKGMLPKGTLGRIMFRRLKVYAGSSHPHAAQKPVRMEVE